MTATEGETITPFGAILRRAVDSTPNAIGAAFADAEGEMVDSFATISKHDWAVLTAHYGIVMAPFSAPWARAAYLARTPLV